LYYNYHIPSKYLFSVLLALLLSEGQQQVASRRHADGETLSERE
jgi:hypothetical protein